LLTISGQKKWESRVLSETPKMTYDSTNWDNERLSSSSKSDGISWSRRVKKGKNAICGGANLSLTPGIALKNFNKQSHKWMKIKMEQGIL